MKIPLAEQMQEAEIHRDALQKAAVDKPALEIRRDRSEAIVLTLHAYAAFEADINRSTNITKGA